MSELEPDAWKLGDLDARTPYQMTSIAKQKEDKQALYSAETIKQILLDKRDEHYDLSDSHSDAKIGLINELIEVFSK